MTNIVPYPDGDSPAERRFENNRRRMLQAIDQAVAQIAGAVVQAQHAIAAYPHPADRELFAAADALISELGHHRACIEKLRFGESDVAIAAIAASLKELLQDSRRRLPALLRELADRQGSSGQS